MTASLPVWSTTKAILTYAWAERGLALRYAALPVVALLLIDVGAILTGLATDKNKWWPFVTGLLGIFAFAPFTVTWFRSITSGDADARMRPVFVFAELEKNVVLANVRVMAFRIAISVVLLVVVLGGAFIHTLNPPRWLAYGVMGIAGGIALFFWTMGSTRVSMVIAYGAAGEPVGLREAFRLTRPMAFRMTWVHIIVATLTMAVTLPMNWAIGFDAHKGMTAIVEAVINAVGGIIYMILSTTLFGFVYRRLKEA
jgi:hypothetical protein